MKRSTKFALATVAILGLGVATVPVIAQQMQPGGMMQGHMGMMGGHDGMRGGGMGMMGGSIELRDGHL